MRQYLTGPSFPHDIPQRRLDRPRRVRRIYNHKGVNFKSQHPINPRSILRLIDHDVKLAWPTGPFIPNRKIAITKMKRRKSQTNEDTRMAYEPSAALTALSHNNQALRAQHSNTIATSTVHKGSILLTLIILSMMITK